MKKAAIFTTYYNSRNFGGLLQAYALQQALLEMDVDGIDISYVTPVIENEGIKPSIVKRIKDRFENSQGNVLQVSAFLLKKMLYKKIYGNKVEHEIKKRNAKFKEFRERAINHTIKIYSDKNIYELGKMFDLYITGSDLVWNLGEEDGLLKGFWLDFESDNPKLSYAASMPMRRITAQQRSEIKRVLKGYMAVSVREDVGFELLDKEIEPACEYLQVVDPVFLLGKKRWDAFSESIERSNKKYILAYFLGDDPEHRKLVKWIAKERGLSIVSISHAKYFCMDDVGFGECMIDISPMNFVWLFSNADVVVTDSFHGAAFSLIYDKEFYVSDRFTLKIGNTLNNRLYSLLRLSDNDERLLNGNVKQMYEKYSLIENRYSCNKGDLPEMISVSKDFLKRYI
ncbi:MAG: polysaccharide pyruvyl transferase family protein [Lachnospiraceae bacterium]|nr:polysaccharide pyruvyl transferase family protein [Lachnospiraceae bacterium]